MTMSDGHDRIAIVAEALATAPASAVAAGSGPAGDGGPTGARRAAVSILAIGDSTGVGVGARNGGYVDQLFARLNPARQGGQLVNLCRSGATLADAIRDQLPRARTGASLVLVGIGNNDVTVGTPLGEFTRQYRRLLTSLHRQTGAPIVVSNIPDMSLAPAVPAYARPIVAERVAGLNRAIASVVAETGATLFDTFAMSREVLPAHPEFFSADGYHPSDAGYILWAQHLSPLAQRALAGRPR
jgi:acyl-CoA thioesterase-1